MSSPTFNGPHGLVAVVFVTQRNVDPPFFCRLTESTKEGMATIMVITDASGRIIVDAWLSKKHAAEHEQAIQWLCDLVGAKYSTEVQR